MPDEIPREIDFIILSVEYRTDCGNLAPEEIRFSRTEDGFFRMASSRSDDFNSVPPPTASPDILLGALRNWGYDMDLPSRRSLFAWLSEHRPIPCYFCGANSEGILPLMVPSCAEHRYGGDPSYCENCGHFYLPCDWDRERDCCVNCVEEEGYVCESCGERSDDCEELWPGENYCGYCRENRINVCDCGNYIRPSNSDQECCRACSRSTRGVHIHDARTDVCEVLGSHLYGEAPKDGICYGVELELEVSEVSYPDTVSAKFREILKSLGEDFIILKYDGSLGENGVEINTLPCTLKVQKEKWKKFFNDKPDGLRSWNGGRCGIHVHITRKPLGMLTIGKMVVFLNDPKNKGLILKIAGRYDNGYSKVKEKKVGDLLPTDRYEMLNITGDETVEIRIFRGTLNRKHFFADLEFVECLLRFCKSSSVRGLTTEDFYNYLRQERKAYPNLFSFLMERGEEGD